LLEILTGICFVLVADRFSFHPLELALYLYFTFALITISGIDFFFKIIPDELSLSLIVLGLLASPLNYDLGPEWKFRLINSVAGGTVGFLSLFLIGCAGEKLFHKETMGGGDVKLLAGIGAMIGLSKTLSTLFLGSLLGSVLGIVLIAAGKIERKDYIPFGPFLAAAAFGNLVLPRQINYINNIVFEQTIPLITFLKDLLDKFY